SEMTEDSVRSSKSAAYASETQNDSEVILMHLILDLQSENNNLHTPALRRLLDIVVDQPGSNKQVLQYRLIPILNKFSGIINQSEEYVLSTTILHIIGVRGNCDDKTSSDENLSKSGNPSVIDIVDVDGLMKKITTKQQKTNVVSLTQVLENGIYSEEIQFSNSKYVRAVGIVRDTYIIPAEVNPCDKHYKKHFAYYSGRHLIQF
ncbi:MAG: hypothetical protein EZS28_018626, partial [Streblomastix strix]